MRRVAELVVESVWSKIDPEGNYKTPSGGSDFSIASISEGFVIIQSTKSQVKLPRQSFVDSLCYLLEHNHIESNPCEIRSNNDSTKAGPLCLAARRENSNTRCITYILPILEHEGVVGISGTGLNSTWLR